MGCGLRVVTEKPDATHPLEVWTGINFGLAAFLLTDGTEAFHLLAEAAVHQIYENEVPYLRSTTAQRTFRACMYL